MCAAGSVMVFTEWVRRREMIMCAAISIIICYRGARWG